MYTCMYTFVTPELHTASLIYRPCVIARRRCTYMYVYVHVGTVIMVAGRCGFLTGINTIFGAHHEHAVRGADFTQILL